MSCDVSSIVITHESASLFARHSHNTHTHTPPPVFIRTGHCKGVRPRAGHTHNANMRQSRHQHRHIRRIACLGNAALPFAVAPKADHVAQVIQTARVALAAGHLQCVCGLFTFIDQTSVNSDHLNQMSTTQCIAVDGTRNLSVDTVRGASGAVAT